MSEDPQDTQPATQSTQEYSQTNGARPNEDHLWGYLHPCSSVLHRIDFWKLNPSYTVGRHPTQNQVVMPGLKISAFLDFLRLAFNDLR